MASFIALRHFNFLSLITSKLCSPLTNLTSCTFNSSFFLPFKSKYSMSEYDFQDWDGVLEKWWGEGWKIGDFGDAEKIWLVFLRRKTAFFLFMHLYCCFFFFHFSNSLSLVFSRIFQRTLSRQVEIVGEFLPYSKDLCSMNCPFFYHVQRKTSNG